MQVIDYIAATNLSINISGKALLYGQLPAWAWYRLLQQHRLALHQDQITYSVDLLLTNKDKFPQINSLFGSCFNLVCVNDKVNLEHALHYYDKSNIGIVHIWYEDYSIPGIQIYMPKTEILAQHICEIFHLDIIFYPYIKRALSDQKDIWSYLENIRNIEMTIDIGVLENYCLSSAYSLDILNSENKLLESYEMFDQCKDNEIDLEDLYLANNRKIINTISQWSDGEKRAKVLSLCTEIESQLLIGPHISAELSEILTIFKNK